jgi:hypothetical protein
VRLLFYSLSIYLYSSFFLLFLFLFVLAKNPGGGRRIRSQLQVFQSSRHRGHCRKGRRFFVPKNLVNAEIIFRTTHKTKSGYVSEQSSEKVSINPNPGLAFLLNPDRDSDPENGKIEKSTVGKKFVLIHKFKIIYKGSVQSVIKNFPAQ